FNASNNEAEYEALIAGLRIAAEMGVRNVQVSVDSKLVANQVLGTKINTRKGGDDHGRGRRTDMDDPIMEYLKDGTLPDNKKEAIKLCIKARQYELMEGTLYKRSFLKPWLSFHKWGIDIAGPLPRGSGKSQVFYSRFADYFTKWLEAKAHGDNQENSKRANGALGEGIKVRLGKEIRIGLRNSPMFYGTTAR
ncbi:reverse transcriptase domain-containing protein, partial [Tanacetum coccineum]